jgi:hypothetical protein
LPARARVSSMAPAPSGVAEHGLAFAINGVVAGLDAVLGQDAALDALGDAVQRCDKRIHASVVHRGARQKHAGRLQIDVGIGNRHRSSTGFYFTASGGICGCACRGPDQTQYKHASHIRQQATLVQCRCDPLAVNALVQPVSPDQWACGHSWCAVCRPILKSRG